MMQPQRIDKDEEGAIVLDNGREDFLANLERECEEIREEMRKTEEAEKQR